MTPEILLELDVLVGSWRGSGVVHPNPWGPAGSSRADWTFRWDADRMHLIGEYVERRGAGHRFNGLGILSHDRETARLLWFFFDSYGYPPDPPASGQLESGALILEKESLRGRGRTIFNWTQDRLSQSVSAMPVGATDFMPLADLVFERV